MIATIILGVAAEPCLLAVAHRLDHIAGGFQRGRNVRRNPPIVLDHRSRIISP